jgi:hypothetical protein
VIPHLHEHLFHAGEAKLADVVLLERVQLGRCNLVLLDPGLFDGIGAYVLDRACP